jgi:DNA-binding transcriptional MerR regulator
MDERFGIDELAEAAGLTRRAVRYYVQQKLLPTPLGVGRGKHYDGSHLERLKRLLELQSAGYSLDAIRQILDGAKNVPPPESPPRPRTAGRFELWTRVKLADGLELHFDAQQFQPDAAQLLAAREALRAAFNQAASVAAESERADRKSRSRNGDE